MKTLKVVTVVVSYNAYHGGFFPRCLEHLREVQLQNNDYRIDHRVIVVDSHSGDETPDKVRAAFSWAEVIASKENLGYAGGNNVGMQKALSQNADYIAVVTQDVYVKPDWLLEAVKAAEQHPDAGVVQPLLLLWPERDRINSTGNAIHFLGYGYAGDYQRGLSTYDHREVREIPYFSGAVALFRAKALRQVGLFDEEMWMYNEDQDLGWRLWLQGYKNILAPQSRAYHQYEFSRSITKMYYMDRNRLLVVLQNYHWATLLLIVPFLLLNELAGLVLAVKGGWKKEKLAVWKYFLKPSSWIKLLKKRRLRQSSRTVPDKQVVKRFTGKILFQDVMNPVITYVANPLLSSIWKLQRIIIFW